MDFLKKVFPYSFKPEDVKSLIVTLIVYVVIGVVGGILLGLLGRIPLIGWLFRLIAWLLDIYVCVGFILAVLKWAKIVK